MALPDNIDSFSLLSYNKNVFHVKDCLDHEHPQPSIPMWLWRVLAERCRPIAYGLFMKSIGRNFSQAFRASLCIPEDKAKIKELLKKPWNLMCSDIAL
jgi:hypothetical protein